MKFTEYFTNIFETSDRHHIKGLETHYYKCFKTIVVDAIKKLEIEFGGKVVDENQFGEILFECNKFTAVFTVVFLNGKTSVDIKMSGNYIIPFARPAKDIIAIYSFLDKHLPILGDM